MVRGLPELEDAFRPLWQQLIDLSYMDAVSFALELGSDLALLITTLCTLIDINISYLTCGL